MKLSTSLLRIDSARESERIAQVIQKKVREFKQSGVVVRISDEVDSATVLGLAVKALGPDKVIALSISEQDSNAISEELAVKVAAKFGVPIIKEDLTTVLKAVGCYERRNKTVRQLFPDYDPQNEAVKLLLPSNLLEHDHLNVYSLLLVDQANNQRQRLLSSSAYLEIVAALNIKQRMRMLTLYYHAEKRNYAVVGTANKNEYGQGLLVKYGDGEADIQPIQHLYKTQVHQLARYLEVPSEIIERSSTRDTYRAELAQEEFYFRWPFEIMDVVWYGLEHHVPAEIVAQALDLAVAQVEGVYQDLAQKVRTTESRRTPPVTLNPASLILDTVMPL